MTAEIVDQPDAGARPRHRGRIHQGCAWLAPIAAGSLLIHASTARGRVGAAAYAVALQALFTVSAVYHRVRWVDPATRRRMRRADHATIHVFIAGTYTPLVLTVLHGWVAWVTGVGVWVLAAAGVAGAVAERGQPQRWRMGLYLATGWVALLAMPQLVAGMTGLALALLVGGGALYTVGALAFLAHRPAAWPTTFGYHEVWHTFVTAACACQYAALWSALG